jgi:AraC-like DNA-binding protein
MVASTLYPVSPAWHLLMRDLGVSVADVLRRAGVAGDLLAREQPMITAEEWARLAWAFDAEVDDPTFAIRVGEALSFEMFDPAVFAAMCSADLVTGLERLSRYKRLCAPMALDVATTEAGTRVTVRWTEPEIAVPPALLAVELTYAAKLARLGTRRHVVPLRVTSPFPALPADAYAAYFGVAVTQGETVTIEFARADATAPFLTARAGMWGFFEPELRRHLAELEATATTAERARSALLELLPSGRSTVAAVATRLGVSGRTLQRRLGDEGTSFQRVLDATREELARHYLATSTMPGAEISFLLGFEDPNSFGRAFHEWTGLTPEQARAALRPRSGAIGWRPGASRE